MEGSGGAHGRRKVALTVRRRTLVAPTSSVTQVVHKSFVWAYKICKCPKKKKKKKKNNKKIEFWLTTPSLLFCS